MAQTAQQTTETWKEKLDKALHEKGTMSDLLGKAEQKTGLRRLYIVLGKFEVKFMFDLIDWMSYEPVNLARGNKGPYLKRAVYIWDDYLWW